MGYGQWLHGEAVAAGMCMAADLSRRQGWIDTTAQQRTRELVRRARLPVAPPTELSTERFLELMAVDKKVLDGGLRLVLLQEIGRALVTEAFDQALLRQTLDERPVINE